ncbi:hypothetical protein [Gracilimonas sediminicola]|uniref:hypothetical protein n=1 Tax=Gracilimonas sediminicola TaxID=2952158 RepID=UPI0038D4162A
MRSYQKYIPLLILAALMTGTLSATAQSPIDITSEHASLGRKLANQVWSSFEGSVISVPQRKTMSTGKKGDYIKLTFREYIRKETFRNTVNRMVTNDNDMINAVSGWSDEDGELLTLIILNASDMYQRAMCLVLYSKDTKTAIFNIMSSKL